MVTSLQRIKIRSVSEKELIVSYADALELVSIFEQLRIRILGWEGWLLYENGNLELSQDHQGTSDLTELSDEAIVAFMKTTISQAKVDWDKKPENRNAELYFCITPNE